MNCLFCAQTLEQLFKNKTGRRYCSHECKIKMNQRTKTCPACNKQFNYLIKKNIQRTYCSNKCSASLHNIRHHREASYKNLTNEEALQRLKNMFFKNIEKTKTCWLWTGGKRGGYGQLKWKNKTIRAHRASYLIHYNELPNHLFVCHKCDIPLCVNPEHLFLGNNTENMHDMINKGRSNFLKHNNHPMKKITIEIAREIRKSIKDKKYSLTELANKYNLSYQNIWQIKNNKTWKE
jgi:hypothetical protein